MKNLKFSDETKKALIGSTITEVGDDFIRLDDGLNVYIIDEYEIINLNDFFKDFEPNLKTDIIKVSKTIDCPLNDYQISQVMEDYIRSYKLIKAPSTVHIENLIYKVLNIK